jgi:uncharacterized UPF0160 family protein
MVKHKELFPNIMTEQVVIIQAERSTGIVLNQYFEYYNKKEKQEKYLIFDSLETAKEYIKKIKNDLNKELEFIIYNSKQEILETINCIIDKEQECANCA